MNDASAQTSLADRLRGSAVAVRGDLDVSRHVFRDGIAYVVRDPVSFATHRLAPEEYTVLCALNDDQVLGEVFASLTENGALETDEEEDFYAFVLDLHQRSMLTLPINDGDALYRRHERKRRAKRLSKVMGVLFLRVPLVNPDRFLSRTVAAVRWLFSWPAFVLYAALTVTAGVIAYTRFDELTQPFLTMVSGGNAVLLWTTLIGLKVLHELGHAYACKVFGGHVPEMGAYLILFTPCAYVDATDSWSFTSTRQRAIVTLAGLYIETAVGAIAMIVWAFTGPSTLNTVAYQVVLLSTVVTIGFNLNPLMRYDAYYLVSDLTGIPNLRARSKSVLATAAKRVMFGLRPEPTGEPRGRAIWLGSFGTAQMLYKATLMVSIAAVVVIKFGAAGIWIAAMLLGMTLWAAIAAPVRYVAGAEEMAGRRTRGALALAGVAAAALALVAALPIPADLDARGISAREHAASIRAPVDGFVRELPAGAGDAIQGGAPIATIEEPALDASVADAEARLNAALVRARLAPAEDGASRAAAIAQTRSALAALDHATRRADIAAIQAPIGGTVTAVYPTGPGVFVRQGDPIATVEAGRRTAVFLIPEAKIDGLEIALGDTVTCRADCRPGMPITGTVLHIDRAAERTLRHPTLSAAAGGPVAVDPKTGAPAEPLVEIRLALESPGEIPDGAVVRARFPGKPTTIARVAQRRVALFFNKARASVEAP